MGEVYKATNIINNTECAIKMIRSDLSHDPELVNKFIQEDEALRQLNNPAVVRYYGVRREPTSGRFYIQMEYVNGPTLGEFVREHGAVSPDAARELCRHLALGLEDAHHCGIVHRDISPDNVLLGNSDLKQAKIIDFGIAKVASTGDFTTFRTSFVGKYRYASPEHFSAQAPIDQRSDIYSLGLVIAAAAAGAPLDMGRDELSGATARLRVPDLTSVPAPLRPMLARMLDPDPARRPTAAQLVAQLSAPTATVRSGGTALWAGLLLLLLVLVGGGAGAAWMLLRKPPAPVAIATRAPDAVTPNSGASNPGGPSAAIPDLAGTGTGAVTTQAVDLRPPPPAVPRRAPFDAVQRTLAAEPGACAPLLPAALDPSRIQISGLVAARDAADRAAAAAAGLGYAVDDRIAVSAPACQVLQLLGQLGKVNAATGANRPIMSASRTPAVFRVGEAAGISAVVPLTADHHLYRIAIDGGTGMAAIDHRVSHSFVDLSSSDPVTAAGWDLVAVIVAPRDLPAFDAARQMSLEQLNAALESELAQSANRRDLLTAYQFIRRID